MVGIFINTLPTRVRLSNPSTTISNWLKGLQKQQIDNSQFEFSSLSRIQSEWSQVPKGSPLFESILVYENYPVQSPSKDALLNIDNVNAHESPSLPLTFVVSQISDHFNLDLLYAESRFIAADIERLWSQVEACTWALVSSSADAPIGSISTLTQTDLSIITKSNSARAPWPQTSLIHHLFEQQAEATPDKVLVVCEDEQATFRFVNERSTQLARYIRTVLGVRVGEWIGVCMYRSIEMFIALIAVLKAGCGYVPVDPTYPEARQQFSLQDSGCRLLLTQSSVPPKPYIATVCYSSIACCVALLTLATLALLGHSMESCG